MASKRKASTPLSGTSTPKRSNKENETNGFGIIESISLKNFMCHGRLTMRFTSSVNFVVGHNGSGKSAVLTALIVGLGGKTSNTSRGTSLKTLIKTGSTSATIEIVLRNNGAEPVRPEIYGSKIIVERRITCDGQSSYKIKNDSNKVISTKKDDLLTILDEINLHVDNPLTCLNQEMSKNFLHSKNESDKYKFFLKATQLEQMSHDYRYIRDHGVLIKTIINRKQKNIPDLEKEVFEKEQQFKDLAQIQDLKTKINELKSELAWSQVIQLQHFLKPTKRELERENLKTPKYDVALEKCREKEMAAQHDLDELQKKVKDFQRQVKQLEPKKLEAKKAFDEAKMEEKRSQNVLGRTQQQKRETIRDRKELETRIEELKNSAKTDIEDEKQKREESLAQLREQYKSSEAQVKNLSHQIEQFAMASQRLKENIHNEKREEQELQHEQRRAKHAINSLSLGRKNRLQLFGSKMPDFVQKIEDAWNKKRFSKKPRGPIGTCVTVKDANLVVPVECAIRGFMTSFVVDNHGDEKILEALRNSTFSIYERSRIVIYTMEYSSRVYDVSKGQVEHPQFSSVLNLLKIDDPVIANLLIDMAGIECILVIPDVQDALRTIQCNRPPPNCIKAFTGNGDEVLIDRFYSNKKNAVSKFLKVNVDDEIKKNKEILKMLQSKFTNIKQNLNKAEKELRSSDQEQLRYERSKAATKDKLRKISVEIKSLEAIEDPQPLDVKDLEDEVAHYTQQLGSLDVLIEQQTQDSQNLAKHTKEKQQALAKCVGSVKHICDSAEDLTEKINKASSDLETAKAEKKHFTERKKKHLESVETLKLSIKHETERIEEESKKAAQICPEKISTRRTPNNIENEIKQINRRISQEETTHGDHEVIVREYNEVLEKFKYIKRQIKMSRKLADAIENYLEEREAAFSQLRRLLSARCAFDFDVLLRMRGFVGSLTFDHENNTLSICVKPHENSASLTKDLKALSGGERSFSTVCFVLALWEAMHSPLRCLDEFDVFMDMANRRVAMDMMVDIALLRTDKQFIFLTPHDISALPKSKSIHVWKMADPERGQTTLPF